ncbi:MAG: helix-turn-helix domain-containing protein [Pyrinomonadaceae bacterium]
MEIIWQNENLQSQYSFRQRAEWTGVKVLRSRIMPGRMLEHEAEFHEINISVSGSLTTEKISAIGKRKVFCGGNGGLCITQAGQTVGASWEKPLDHLGIFLAPAFVASVAAENRFSPRFDFDDDFTEKDLLVQHIGLALLAEENGKTPEGKLYADSLINTLTLHLLKNYSNAKSVSENTNGGLSGYKLRRVTEFISENLEADLSLAAIAAVADLSQFHFARAFRKSTNLTPQNYLMRQRIERAKQLLAKDDLPIVEISLQTGFKNQSHFTTLFRKHTKFTPKAWRELKLA